MKKIILTESQKKMLEDYQQLESGRNEVLNFNSSINYAYIDFNGHDNIWEVDTRTDLRIDWSLLIKTDENGYSLIGKCNYLHGKVVIINYETKEVKEFNIDKAYKVDASKNFNSNMDGQMSTERLSVFIDFNKKEIIL